ncbi:low molecular weight phosphatase family protein [Corynebacterium nasicanis]|uniref:Low molecular weight phosphatase family protein n=1 Tax=Corynebacterium nasicanis TaxID=1448267 RepID=A0ABW1QBF0_9CORY
MSDNFRILTICTGNICRSPLAKYLLAAQLRDIPEIEVDSAGTHPLTGAPMFDVSRAVAESFGVEDTSDHRARAATEQLLAGTDLVLAMSREHRRHVVELHPPVTRRVFTIREFARLAAALPEDILEEELRAAAASPVERLRAAVRAVALSRSMHALPADPEEDDVVDPYRRELSVHETSAADIEAAVDAVVALLVRVAQEDSHVSTS